MNTISTVSDIARWFLITSLKATIVIALIMTIRLAFGDRLPAKWQHALWFLLIVRLVLPINMPTPFSLFNLTDKVPYRPAPPAHLNIEYSPPTIEKPAAVSFDIRKQNPAVNNEVIVQSYSLSVMEIASLLWLVGLASLLLYAAGLNLATWLRFRDARPIEDSRVNNILKSSQEKLGVKKHIRLFQIDKTTSPFWFGQFRPRIYFPSALVESLSDKDLEHIFLHELAHFKRKDIVVSMMQTLLQAAHWFNPLIWYAFVKMLNDRESACDEMVLNKLGQHRSEAYGLTLISLLRYANRNGLMPVTVGLADTQEDIRHRIDRIANFSIKSRWWEVFMFVIVLVISLLALTSATESASISGEITFQGGARPDTIYVGLYDARWHENFGRENNPPLELQKLTRNNTYSFHAEQGLYTLVAWAFGYEHATFRVFLKEDKTDLKVDFELAASSLPEALNHVTLIGDFCRWSVNYVTPLTQENGVWRTPAPRNLKIGDKYSFLVWDKEIPDFYTYATDRNTRLVRQYSLNNSAHINENSASFEHVYNGEREIVFDDALFKRQKPKDRIGTHCCELAKQYDRLYHDRLALRQKKSDLLNDAAHAEKNANALYTYLALWDSLETRYDATFHDIFVEEKLKLYSELWTGNSKYLPLIYPDASAEEKTEFYESEQFNKAFADIVSLVKQLNPDSRLYEGGFVLQLIWYIPGHLKAWPALEEKHDITLSDCQDILDDFVRHSPLLILRESIVFYTLQDLYVSELRHSRTKESAERQAQYEKILQHEYADSWVSNSLEKVKERIAANKHNLSNPSKGLDH